jgi:hypothetical protein
LPVYVLCTYLNSVYVAFLWHIHIHDVFTNIVSGDLFLWCSRLWCFRRVTGFKMALLHYDDA